MRRLEPNQIREEFNQQKQVFRKWGDETGLNRAVEALSAVISDLKDAGMDVELQLFGGASEKAFALFPHTSGLTVPVSGALRIGPNHRLIGIATKLDGQAALRLGMSEFDSRLNGPEASFVLPKAGDSEKKITVAGTLRAFRYDLAGDTDGLVKFEKDVIKALARNAVVDDYDAANAFDNGRRLGKAALKLPQKP